jgi:hypothetical protein
MSYMTIEDRVRLGMISNLEALIEAYKGSIKIAAQNDLRALENTDPINLGKRITFLPAEGYGTCRNLYDKTKKATLGADKMFLLLSKKLELPKELKEKKILFPGTLLFDKERDPFVFFIRHQLVTQTLQSSIELERCYLRCELSSDMFFAYYL